MTWLLATASAPSHPLSIMFLYAKELDISQTCWGLSDLLKCYLFPLTWTITCYSWSRGNLCISRIIINANSPSENPSQIPLDRHRISTSGFPRHIPLEPYLSHYCVTLYLLSDLPNYTVMSLKIRTVSFHLHSLRKWDIVYKYLLNSERTISM